MSRLYNNDTTALEGTVYIYEDDTVASGVPQTPAKVHITITAGDQQSKKAATTLSNEDYCLLTEFYGGLEAGSGNARVDFVIQVRLKGKVFRDQLTIGTSDQFIRELSPYYIVPKNADIRVRAQSSSTNIPVDAGFTCILAKVVN